MNFFNKFNNLKNKKNLVSIILMVIALIAIGGITYASFNINLEGLTNIKAVTPSISLTYEEAPNPLEQTNKMLADEEYKTSSDYFEFKVTSSSNIVYDLYYNIYLTEKENNTLSKDNLYIYLTLVEDNSEILVKGPIKVSDLTNYTKCDNSYIIKSDNFSFLNNKEETKERIYRLRIWNKPSVTSSSISIAGGNYEYIINVDTYKPISMLQVMQSQVKTMNISYNYKNDANVTVNGTIYNNGDNGVFLYNGTDDNGGTYPVYYYRGNVDNNNLIFANMCWKIVRTTSTGGIKLIYNGLPSSDGACISSGEDATIGKSVFNENYNSPAYVGYMYGTIYIGRNRNIGYITDEIMYGNDVTYDEDEELYTLSGKTISFPGSSFATEKLTLLDGYHYTCLNTSGICDEVYYMTYFGDGTNNAYPSYMYYLTFTDGDNLDKAMEKMFDINPNQTSSVIKTYIDNWYEENLIDYNSSIENTIFCNDRSIGTTSVGGNLRSKDYNFNLGISYFSAFERKVVSSFLPSLICPKKVDSFSLSTDNGGIEGYGNNALKYPIGLLTVDEALLAGGQRTNNNNYYLYNDGINSFLMSPGYSIGLYNEMSGIIDGYITPDRLVSDSSGVRPVISLKQGIDIVYGTGLSNDPYLIIK